MTSNQSLIRAWTKLDMMLKREEEDPDATLTLNNDPRRSISPSMKTSHMMQSAQTLKLRPATAKNAVTMTKTRPSTALLRPSTAKIKTASNLRPLSGTSTGNLMLTIDTKSPTSVMNPMLSNFLSPTSTMSRTNIKSAMSRSSAILISQFSPKAKFFDDNSIIHSVTMPELTKLYEMKCADNKIESSQNQLKYFLDKFDKSCKKRILDFEDQSIGIASALEIANILINNNHFIKINLSRNFVSDQGAKYLAAALKENETIIHLDVGSCNLGVEGASALFEVLLENSSIISLKINSYEGLYRNRFDHRACSILTDVLSTNKVLQFLNLSNCSIGTDGAMCIARGIENNHTLVHLDLSANDIGPECALHLSKAIASTSLAELIISGNRFGDQGLIHLFHMFSTASVRLAPIDTLDISKNGLTTIGLSKLCEILTKNQTIKKLILDHNQFNGKAIVGIINLLWENGCLKTLSMKNCQMGIDAANALATGFQRNRTIDTLYLNKNNLGDKGIVALAEALRSNNVMRKLDLTSCKGKDEGGKAIADLIRNSISLHVVELKDNALFDPTGIALSEAIKANKNIKKVSLDKNPIAYKFLEDIRKHLEKNNNDLNRKKLNSFGTLMTELKVFENEKYRVADEKKENEYTIDELKIQLAELNEQFEIVKQEEYEKYDIVDKEYQKLWNDNRGKDKERERLDEIIRTLNQDIIIGTEVSESENRKYQDEFFQLEKEMRTIKEEHEAARVHYEKTLERLKKELKDEEKKVNVYESQVQMTENQVIKLKLSRGGNTPRLGVELGGFSRQNSTKIDRKQFTRQSSGMSSARDSDGSNTDRDKGATPMASAAVKSGFSKEKKMLSSEGVSPRDKTSDQKTPRGRTESVKPKTEEKKETKSPNRNRAESSKAKVETKTDGKPKEEKKDEGKKVEEKKTDSKKVDSKSNSNANTAKKDSRPANVKVSKK